MILYEKTKKISDLDFDSATVYSHFFCICDYCGKEFTRTKRNILSGRKVIEKESCGDKLCAKSKREESQLSLYGVKNAGGTSESQQKAKRTWLEKYDVQNPMKSDIIKDKVKQTCRKKYGEDSYLSTKECKEHLKNHCNQFGVENPGQVAEYKHKIKDTCIEKYGTDHPLQNKKILQKRKQTCIDKYGVENPTQLSSIKEKQEQTNLERHGVRHAIQNKEIKEKQEQANLERHGVRHAIQSKEIKEKQEQTNLERYDAANPMKNEQVKNKVKKTCLEKYGVASFLITDSCRELSREWSIRNYGAEYYSQTKECKDKIEKTCLEKYGETSYSKTDEFKSRYRKTCMEKYNVPTTLLYQDFRVYGKAQKELADWLESIGCFFESDYEILNGKEIDLLNRDLGIGIEYCGLFWHNELSPTPRPKKYHYDKFVNCKKNGIQLITLFEDEWLYSRKQCENIIKGLLGIHKKRLYARKCHIREIDKKICNHFLNENHLQGKNNRSKIQFGLYSNNELIGVMSLSNHHRKVKGNPIVLDRLCFSNDVQIIGGASKLLKACVKWSKENEYDQIITWSDNRWSNGNVYEKMGFNFDGELPPDYSYVDLTVKNKVRLSKQSQKKSNTNCPEGKTELEWATERKLARIWDCGKKRWKIDLIPS